MAFLILVSQGILSVQGRAGARDYHLKGQFVPKISDKRDKLAKEWINLGKFVIKFDKIEIYFADIFRRQPPWGGGAQLAPPPAPLIGVCPATRNTFFKTFI